MESELADCGVRGMLNGGCPCFLPVSEGDLLFRHWSNVQVLLHAETYFHSHALGLMPDSHWRGYARYMSAHAASSGFAEDWANLGASFSEDFRKWIDSLVVRLPPAVEKVSGTIGPSSRNDSVIPIDCP